MKPTTKIVLFILVCILLGYRIFLIYTHYDRPKVETPMPVNSVIVYTNVKYGFIFSLPNSWKGYTIIEKKWEGSPLAKNVKEQSGPKLIVRNPLWTEAEHYEDIPILVFTIAQWDGYMKEDFAVSAAPILARELGRNNTYVFALPPRWDFDYSTGVKEAEDIVNSNPLKGFDVSN